MGQSVLHVGVIGAGGIARSVHLPALHDIPSCRVVWICDLFEDRACAAAEQWGIAKHGISYSELIAEDRPDAVFVLVQPDHLYRIALDCIHAGCHVFMEKPMGITLFQAESIARAARGSGCQCQAGFNRRFIPLMQSVLAKMRALAPIHQVDGWFYKNGDASFYGGCASAFLCDAIHTIDLLRFAAGSEARQTLQLAARCGGSEVDNAWNAIIAFENGATGTMHSNYATGGRVHGFAIHNNKASAYVNLGFGGEACRATILHHVRGTYSLSANGAGEQLIEELDGIELAGSSAYYRYYGYYDEDLMFVTSLLQGRPVPCSAEDALGSMRLADMLARNEIHLALED